MKEMLHNEQDQGNQQLFNYLYQAPAAMAVVHGPQHVFSLANGCYQKLFKRTSEELLGKTVREVWPEIFGQGIFELFDEVYVSGKPHTAHAFPATINENGEAKKGYYDFTLQPIKDQDGKVADVLIHVVEVTAQTTARKELEESQARAFQFLKQIPVALTVYEGPEFKVAVANKHTLDVWGKTEAELLNRPVLEVAPELETTGAYQAAQQVLQTGIPFEARELPIPIIKDGEEHMSYFDVVYTPWYGENGEVRGVITVGGDVTEAVLARKKVEESEAKYRTLAGKLEQTVTERTKELQRSNDELEQFAHVASHDLKEPVRKISVFANRLKMEFESILPERGKLYLSKIESSAERMNTMINGVLHYALLGHVQITHETVELDNLVQNIIADLEIPIIEKKASIQFRGLPAIDGSYVLMHQLLYNLLNNSLKFSKPDVKPLISITAQKGEPQDLIKGNLANDRPYIKLVVSDNGIGFDPTEVDNIFQSFTRLHGRDHYEGTGLGLSLCKKIVERHSGAIWAEGEEGKGARFIILLPAAS